jgi:release factor glutamine methyltransferase
MYLPAEDTSLLAESVKGYEGRSALEIGVGSGAVLKVLRENFWFVAATDIDFASLKFCKDNLLSDIMLVCCDAASAFRYRFDLIVSNPPYLPAEDNEKIDFTVHGGPEGVETTVHFIKSSISALAENGKMLIVMSNLSNNKRLEESITEMNLKRKIISQKKLFFETLTSLEICK